jgi:glycine cleavage system regulatory protein
MIPSWTTRLVEASWNAIAEVKSALRRKRDRADATEA